jgi:serine/threonine protein kinase
MTGAAAAEELRVGPYRLHRRLGKGGAGQAYLAWRDNPTRKRNVCVVKMPHAGDATDAEVNARFLQEGELGLALGSHDNLVHVFDVDLYRASMPYMAMEYVDGIDLGRLLKCCIDSSTPLSVSSIHHIISGVASALHHAHTEATIDNEPLRIVHRDVKPENVLISRDGAVKLMDFGVGVALHDGTAARKLRGTYRYMSPEHIDGEVCEAMDIYSLGVLSWELLANARYRVNCDGEAHLSRIIAGDIPSLRHSNRQLVNLVLSCLSQHPGLRPTAAELLEALGRCEDHSRDPMILRQEILPIVGRRRSSGASGQQAAAEPEAIATLTAVDHAAVQAASKTAHVPSWEVIDGKRIDRDAPRSFHKKQLRPDDTRTLVAVRQAIPAAQPENSTDDERKDVDSNATTNPLGPKGRRSARRNNRLPYRGKPVPILTLVRDSVSESDSVQGQHHQVPLPQSRPRFVATPPSLAFAILATAMAAMAGVLLTLLTAYSLGLLGTSLLGPPPAHRSGK